MNEDIIVSGKSNPHIDPVLELWHWPISVYLFLGGLAAGILIFASIVTILDKGNKYTGAVKYATLIPPFALVLGLLALIIDLSHVWYAWRLYFTLRIESPMSWGAWTLLLVTPMSFFWSMSYIKEYFPKWKYDKKWTILISQLIDFLSKNRKVMAWILLPSSILLGIYTGILLSAFNARPLWNNAILGPLFLTSGLSTGAAMIILLSNTKREKKLFSKIDLILIIIELFLITHMIMGMLAGTQSQIDASNLILSGEFAFTFWFYVVGLGLLIPAVLEGFEMVGVKIPVGIPALLVLIGGLVFRFVMIDAGQVSTFVY